MVFFQLDTARFITVYIGQGLIIAFFIYIAFKILRRSKRRLNILLSGYYTFIAIGFLINFIYAPLTIPNIVKMLNTLTNYFVFFGMIFLMLYNLILAKSEDKITNKIQVMLIVIFGALLSVIFFMPNEVQVDASTGWKPVWSVIFFIYLVIVISAVCVIPTIFLSIGLYKRFRTEEIKKRWRRFIVGVYGGYFLMYGTMISNTLNNPTFRLLWSLISISIVFWGYLMYYGVGKSID